MLLSEAIKIRINNLIKEREVECKTLWDLYILTGVPYSTLKALMAKNSNVIPKLDTLQHIADGFQISIRDFFNAPIFDDTEQDEND